MTDTQLLTLAMAVIFPLSMLIYSNSRINEAKETLRARPVFESMALRAGPDIGASLDGASFPKQPGRMVPLKLKDKKGGDISEWPKDLRVRGYPKGLNVAGANNKDAVTIF